MKKIVLFILILVGVKHWAQPVLVNSSAYAHVRSIAHDSVNNRIYYNVLNGCPIWGVPCALTYSAALNNLINKHSFSNNNVSTVLNSTFQIGPPWFQVNRENSAESQQTKIESNFVYTNFGYYFNKIDTLNLSTIWTYSPAVNATFKEVSTFEIKNDSVFFFEKDSSNIKNCYTLFVKNKLSGINIPYSSITSLGIFSSLGSIEGYIKNSLVLNNKIILSGVFTASISGIQVARNLVMIDIPTGQLEVPPVTFTAGTSIKDMKLRNNKIYIAGQFGDINGQARNSYAVLDAGLNLLPETVQFTGLAGWTNTFADKIVFYDKYLIVKGYFGGIDGNYFSIPNLYVVKIIDIDNGNVEIPWTINLPGLPVFSDYAFQMFKNKLYIKNKLNNGSPFYIYCFDPIVTCSNILFPGSTIAAPIPSIAICTPDDGNANLFVAPIRYANSYNWTYSGSNATIVTQGNGSTAKLITGINATAGILSVSGTNDCGLTTPAASLNVIIKPKPIFIAPSSPQIIICNPDSTLLLGTSTNTSVVMWWRKNLTNTIHPQPFYVKNSGNYFMVALDNTNGCKDSTLITVNEFKAIPNATILSHSYQGALIPIDTVTCLKPIVNILAGSDTLGVTITWKSIFNNSVSPNPLATSQQNNFKIIVTRNNNNCVDSSLIVLVGQNTLKPVVSISNSVQIINCSYNTASLNAVTNPTSCATIWNGPLSFTAPNPGITNNSGKYFLTATDLNNGCPQIDSIIVLANNNLSLLISNDTTVCKSSLVNLSALRIGTLAGVTYSWNTGNINNSIAVNPSVTTTYIVYANGPGLCFGTDTVNVTVPFDIQDSIIAFKSCDESETGSIVIFAKGGIPPYKYSINGGNTFLTVNSFTNLAYGNYNLITKDSIGCLKSSTVSLNALSNLPVPKFIASTVNFRSDTVVLVDISVPRADSLHWILPPTASIIGGNMFNPVIVVSDTGSFLITMRSFYGSCIINAVKLIRFGLADSMHANLHNANGIKSFLLFPNPNNGQFTAQIEFYKKQNSSLQVWDTGPNLHYRQNFYDSDLINWPVNLSQLPNGNYILRLIGEYDARTRTFIINK